MPSHKYIQIRGQHVHLHGGRRVGGAVPILLNNVAKYPEISSNKIVGVITPAGARPEEGGRLLHHIHFGSHKKDENSRIKFIF